MRNLTPETTDSNFQTSPIDRTDFPGIIRNKNQLNSELDFRNQNSLNRMRSCSGDTINFNWCFVNSMNNNGNGNIHSVNSNNNSRSHRNITGPNPNQQNPKPRRSNFGRPRAESGDDRSSNEHQIQSMRDFINAPVSADVKAQKLVEILRSRGSTPQFNFHCSSDRSLQSYQTINSPKELPKENTWMN